MLYYARAQIMRSIVSNNRCAHASCRSGTFSPMRAEFDLLRSTSRSISLCARLRPYYPDISLSISSFTQLVRYMYDLCYLIIRDAASGGEMDKRLLEIGKKLKRIQKKKEMKNKLHLLLNSCFRWRRSNKDAAQPNKSSSYSTSTYGVRVIICIMRRSDEVQGCCMTQILTAHLLVCRPATAAATADPVFDVSQTEDFSKLRNAVNVRMNCLCYITPCIVYV